MTVVPVIGGTDVSVLLRPLAAAPDARVAVVAGAGPRAHTPLTPARAVRLTVVRVKTVGSAVGALAATATRARVASPRPIPTTTSASAEVAADVA